MENKSEKNAYNADALRNRKVRKFLLSRFIAFIKQRFDLRHEMASQQEVCDNISKGVEFQGANLWVLIFATLTASLGLNTNSTAVIIGAMLISPLMGPIMGIGFSLGVNNFELMKRSFRNFGFMVVISILTSTLFFMLSPLSEAQSELLARTQPTIYDVMIALFGGLAGMVGQTRKDRTTMVIPGVAIATALMPPLCTAGFGIANGQWAYLGGALYLFFINTVFIAIATYIIVRFMKFEKKVFLDKARERKVKNYMVIIVLLTAIPSIFMSYNIIQISIFDSNVNRFIDREFSRFENTQVISNERQYKKGNDKSHIDLVLIGEALPVNVIDNIRTRMELYGLNDTKLNIKQSDGSEPVNINTLQISYTQLLDEKNRKINELNEQLSGLAVDTLALTDIALEAGKLFDNIETISLSRQDEYDMAGRPLDKALIAVVRLGDRKANVDEKKLSDWLSVRTKTEKVKLYIE